MKRTVISIVAGLLMTMTAQAQPQVLGKSHAMQRVEVKNHYLLLPVQEREDNATIKVLANNQQVQKFNVRLAVDKVDYYVPLEVCSIRMAFTTYIINITLMALCGRT